MDTFSLTTTGCAPFGQENGSRLVSATQIEINFWPFSSNFFGQKMQNIFVLWIMEIYPFFRFTENLFFKHGSFGSTFVHFGWLTEFSVSHGRSRFYVRNRNDFEKTKKRNHNTSKVARALYQFILSPTNVSARVARVVDDDDVYEWNGFKLVKSKAKPANEQTNERKKPTLTDSDRITIIHTPKNMYVSLRDCVCCWLGPCAPHVSLSF